MLSYTVKDFKERLEPVDGPAPVPKGREVVIEVNRCGVCHTDLHIQDGYYDLGGGKRLELRDRGIVPPVVMGHEVLGKLVAKGPEADIADSEIGKSFLIYPWLGCGTCDVCQRGDENLCVKPASIGVFRPGGYAEQCLVPDPKYLVDVTGIDPALACTYACSGLTAYSALNKVEIDRENDLLLILGLGGVGLSGLSLARALGFKRIAVADIDPAKRELAERTGVELTFDPQAEDAQAQLAEIGGFSGAVDFVAMRQTAEFAFAGLRKGGTYVAVGLFGGDLTVPLPPLVQRSITLRGSYVGNLQDLRDLVELVKSGKVEPIPVESVAFDAVNDALGRLRGGKVNGRLVLVR